MNIAILVQDISSLGGVEVVSIWLAKRLAENNCVEIISCKKSKNSTFENSQGVKIEYLGIADSHKILADEDYSVFQNFFSKNRFDIVILQAGTAIRNCCFLSDIKLCKILSKYAKVYYVLHESPKYHLKRYNTAHDSFLKFALKAVHHKIKYARKVSAFFRKARKYIFKFVTLSKGCHKEMKDCYGLDSIIMYNPYSFDSAEIDLSEKENTVLYAGRLSSEKDGRLILESWKAADISNQWKLKIFGDGTEKNSLEDFARNENLSNVEFYGAVSHDKLIEEFKKSKIFVLASFFEGFPTVISEVLNYKNVPVVTRYEGFSDELLKENNSFVCSRNPKEIAKTLEKLTTNSDLLQEFAENGYVQCKKFYELLKEQNYGLETYK